jgi:hypothetical protein
VRLKYLGHGLAAVLDAFCLSQSHDRPVISCVRRVYSTEDGGNPKAGRRTYFSIEPGP